MTDSQNVDQSKADENADVFAAVAILTIVIAGVCFWLAGMPS